MRSSAASVVGASWAPGALPPDRPTYVALADAIALDVARNRLRAGDRLPTHRSLAKSLGVTVGTVARAYAEAQRRGVLSGEVGRGTFVRGGFDPAAQDAAVADLASLHPPVAPPLAPAQLLGATLASLATDARALTAVSETEHSSDSPAHREAAARWVAHGSFAPGADSVLLTAGAQHALTVALLGLVARDQLVATTRLTNPGLVAAARLLSIPLLVVESDEDGMVPEALEEACAGNAVAAVHLQPTLANPTGRSMSAGRRRELAGVVDRVGAWVLEEDPLGPLVPDRPEPLAALLPHRTCHVASAAKVLALGLRVGVLTAPEAAYPRLASAVRASTWLTAPLLGEVLARWVDDGTADRIVQARIEATRERNATARSVLASLDVVGEAESPHLWLPLPRPWSSGAFVNAARDAGVRVAPADDYLADRAQPAFGVRIGLNAEVDDETLHAALEALVRLHAAGPPPGPLA